MQGISSRCGVLLGGLVLVLALAGCRSNQAGALWDDVALPDPGPPPEDEVVRSRVVRIEPDRIREPGAAQLVLPTFDGEVLRATRLRTEEHPNAGFLWVGALAGDPSGTVMLVARGDALIGNIVRGDGTMVQVRSLGNGLHRIQEIDRSMYPMEDEPVAPKLRTDTSGDTCATDSPWKIDVLVVYTEAARVAAGGVNAIEATALLALSETNQSYIDSNVDQRLYLTHIAEVSYTESGNSSTDLDRVSDPNDGLLDSVPTLRDTVAADVVVLITESLSGCGKAHIMEKVLNAFEEKAYAVVKRTCAVGNYSFGHELGHVMGARHDWTFDHTNNLPYTYNHGHVKNRPADTTITPWRTIMALKPPQNARNEKMNERVPYWSNPGLDYPPGGTLTDPMGRAEGMTRPTDNHKTLNNTAYTVANFRCSSPAGPEDVWMKDTWNDTGKEPDPATAGEVMWNSPYIWVRNAQDTALVHQHEHQNPAPDAYNWVYVKLHNGSTTNQGGGDKLEVYAADASTSLAWPTAWKLISTVGLGSTGIAGGSTRILDVKWKPSGQGHYCLLARWVSTTDPMTSPEGQNVEVNVRNNNNLIWRNVEVVPLGSSSSGDEEMEVSLIVRNDDDEPANATLEIRGSRSDRRPSFLLAGEVRVYLDDALVAAWRRGGGGGNGLEAIDGGFLVNRQGARFDGLVLDPGFMGRLTIRFRRLESTPQRIFGLEVLQRNDATLVGGVSYEVRTERTRE